MTADTLETLPDGATWRSVGESKTRVIETPKFGRVALVEWTDYARGEAMGAIAKRLGVERVLLVKDGESETFTADEVESVVEAIHAAAAAPEEG